MELSDVKVGKTYMYINEEDTSWNGEIVTVTSLDGFIWPVLGDFPDGTEGAFHASELSPVVR